MTTDLISITLFGKTCDNVTVIGLGGEGVLRTTGLTDKAESVIEAALQEGIGYFDSAKVYSDSDLYYGSFWKKHPDSRKKYFTPARL